MPPIEISSDDILELLAETALATVVRMYDKGMVLSFAATRYEAIADILAELGMPKGNIDYSLKHFGVQRTA